MKTYKKSYQIILSIFVCISLSSRNHAQLANSPWPMFQHDAQHTGRSQYEGPETPTLAWRFKTPGDISSQVTIDESNRLLFSSKSNFNSTYYALSSSGVLDFNFPIGDGSTAAIANDGTIYIGYMDNLYAFETNGKTKWKYKFELPQYSKVFAPTIGQENSIYIAAGHDLFALNSDGTLKWKFVNEQYLYGIPALDGNGNIYIGDLWDDHLYSIDPNGQMRWKVKLGSWPTNPAVDGDSIVYIATTTFESLTNPTTQLHAVYTGNGNIKWSKSFGKEARFIAPAIGHDGTVYIGSQDSYMYAFDQNGNIKWKFQTGDEINSSAVVDKHGNLYFGSDDNNLYSLNADGTLKWNYQTEGEVGSPTIGSNGFIYFGSADNNVYALHEMPIGQSDLALGAIQTDPPKGVTNNLKVSLSVNVYEKTDSTNTHGVVTFFMNDYSIPIDSVEFFVFAGDSSKPVLQWDPAGLEENDYQLLAKLTSATPSDVELENNISTYTFSIRSFIQPRIDSANSGDTVKVEPGGYQEQITLKNGVYVLGVEGAEYTVLDGGGSGPVISASKLGNTAVLDGFTIRNGTTGIDFQRGGGKIINNIITRNTTGIYMIGALTYSNPIIKNNLISENTGKAIDTNNSWASVVNNTIINNGSGVDGYGYYSSSPTYKNCIIWGNGDDLTRSAVATYSCIEDGDTGFGNISEDPQFIDPENRDYRLKYTSPCLDAGNPTILDPDGSRSDIGAFPFSQGGGRFGAPVNLVAEDMPNDQGGSIFLMWESPPPTLDVSANNITLDSLDLGAYFFIKNTGLGMLTWNATSNSSWLELLPQDGSVMIGNGQLFALAARKNLIIGDYTANIQMTSNGGSENISINMRVGKTPEPGDWQGSGISFDVTEDMRWISDIRLFVGPSNNQYTYIHYGYTQIQGDQTFIHESGDVKITGTFDSRKTVSGTYNIPHSPSPTGTWSASWQPGLLKEKSSSTVSGQSSTDESLIVGYNIYRSQTSEQYESEIASVPGNIFEYLDDTTVDNVGYFYTVKAVDQNGALSNSSNEAGPVISTQVSMFSQSIIPLKFELSQNYPNPFNPETTIKYQLPKATNVKLTIYNSMGQEVVRLLDEHKQAGYHSVNWDAKEIVSGLYFYGIKAGEFEQVWKMLLLR
jgi:outer membrane protein assembly factor BamB